MKRINGASSTSDRTLSESYGKFGLHTTSSISKFSSVIRAYKENLFYVSDGIILRAVGMWPNIVMTVPR